MNLDLLSLGLSTYLAFLNGKVPKEALVPLYTGVDAVTDQPPCHLWLILLQLFPEAKVTFRFSACKGNFHDFVKAKATFKIALILQRWLLRLLC